MTFYVKRISDGEISKAVIETYKIEAQKEDCDISKWAFLGFGGLALAAVPAAGAAGVLAKAGLLGVSLIPAVLILPKLVKQFLPGSDESCEPPDDMGHDNQPESPGSAVPPPKTGDNTPVTMLAALLLSAFAAGGMLVIRKRRDEA